MKKLILIGLLALCLCSCDTQSQPPVDNGGVTDEPQQTVPPSDTSANDTDARIAYYEELVGQLRQEILDMKAEFYVSRVEYEERIAELEAEKQPESGGENLASDFRYLIKDGRVTLTAYVGDARQVVVPPSIEGLPVVAIGDRAFVDGSKLTSVTLPEGVREIGWFAFSGCVSLQKVAIPDSVEKIAYGAFQNCPSSLTVVCSDNSYAAQYAISYGFRTE